MKRVVIIAIAMLFSLSASAQLKVVKMMHEADTLVYATKTGVIAENEFIDVYKNSKGYLIAVHSSNIFDNTQSFYIGRTKESAVQTLRDFFVFCDNDVATSATIADAEGNQFYIRSGTGTNNVRRFEFAKSDRVFLTDLEMAGVMCLKKKVLEEAINALGK